MQLLAYNFPKTHFLFENNESFYQQIKYVSIFVKKKKNEAKLYFSLIERYTPKLILYL